MARAFAEIAFTPTVRALQEHQGSAGAYAALLAPDTERGDRIGPAEAAFIGARDAFYQATVSRTGWPYVQFRGGPAGFLKVLGETTVAYADFRGNRQYLSTGNLIDDNRVSLILVDYARQRRLKIWGRATLVDAAQDPALVDRLRDASYRARPERAVVIAVEALDWNCPQHIPLRLTGSEIDALKAENEALRAATSRPT